MESFEDAERRLARRLGDEIRRLRERNYLTQSTLARKAGHYSRSTIATVETGWGRCSLKLIQGCDDTLEAGGALVRIYMELKETQTRRKEGLFPVLTYAQLVTMAAGSALLMAQSVLWAVAAYNGGTKPPGARDPILVRSHSAGDCAIIGGFVYRGTAISSFNGAYVFGDECTGALRAVVQQNGAVTQSKDLMTNVPQITTFGQGPAGELYAASLNGTLYKLAQA